MSLFNFGGRLFTKKAKEKEPLTGGKWVTIHTGERPARGEEGGGRHVYIKDGKIVVGALPHKIIEELNEEHGPDAPPPKKKGYKPKEKPAKTESKTSVQPAQEEPSKKPKSKKAPAKNVKPAEPSADFSDLFPEAYGKPKDQLDDYANHHIAQTLVSDLDKLAWNNTPEGLQTTINDWNDLANDPDTPYDTSMAFRYGIKKAQEKMEQLLKEKAKDADNGIHQKLDALHEAHKEIHDPEQLAHFASIVQALGKQATTNEAKQKAKDLEQAMNDKALNADEHLNMFTLNHNKKHINEMTTTDQVAKYLSDLQYAWKPSAPEKTQNTFKALKHYAEEHKIFLEASEYMQQKALMGDVSVLKEMTETYKNQNSPLMNKLYEKAKELTPIAEKAREHMSELAKTPKKPYTHKTMTAKENITADELEKEVERSSEVFKGTFDDSGQKKEIATNLATDLRTHPEFQKFVDEFVNNAYGYGLHPMDTFHTDSTERACAALIKKWADTSGDSDKMAIAMQLAARDEFGLTDAGVWWDSFDTKRGQEIYGKHGVALRAFLRAQYDQTQKYFKDKGITHLTLFRGACYNDAKLVSHLGFDEKKWPSDQGSDVRAVTTNAQTQPMNSWSFHPTIAVSFAKEMVGTGAYQVVTSARIPVERVIGSFRCGYGCMNESEVVCLGGIDEMHHVAWTRGNFEDAKKITHYIAEASKTESNDQT